MRLASTSFLTLALGLAATAAASERLAVTHSGFLLDAGDAPVSATLQLRFKLFTQRLPHDSTDTQIWSSDACPVQVSRGYYSVALGDVCNGTEPLSTAHLPADAVRYLEVSIADTPLLPRMLLGSVPSAAVARRSLDTQDLVRQLAAVGRLNGEANPVDWTQLKGVPGGFADGLDNDTTYLAAPAGGLFLLDGAFAIAAGGVTSAHLAAQSVTANALATGAVTASALAAQSVTANALATGAVTASALAAQSVTASALATGAVTANALATGAVTADALATGAVTANALATGAVTANALATGAVTANALAAGAVTANALAPGAVTANALAAGTITADKLAAAAFGTGAGTVARGDHNHDGVYVRVDGATAFSGPIKLAGSSPTDPLEAASKGYVDAQLQSAAAGSCRELLERGTATTDGVYTIRPVSTLPAFQVFCDMTTSGGGWTMVVRLNTNDTTTQKYQSSFWTSTAEVGTLSNANDYLSPAFGQVRKWSSVLVDYRYTTGQAKRMAAAFYAPWGNVGSLRDQVNLTPSNANPSWPRFFTSNAAAAGWYGANLIFQTLGNDADNFRIWFNQVAVDACNQAGGIGCQGDGGSWFNEVSFPSTTASCQENLIRGTIGTNGGGSLMTETLLAPADAYDFGIMTVLVR